MQTDEVEEALEHYGILGMRWGVRRTPEQLQRARARRKEKGKPVTPTKASTDAAKARASQKKADKKGVDALTNQELQELNKRLNLEQNYKQLTDTPKQISLVSKGTNEATKIMADVARSQTKNIANYYATKAVKEALKLK